MYYDVTVGTYFVSCKEAIPGTRGGTRNSPRTRTRSFGRLQSITKVWGFTLEDQEACRRGAIITFTKGDGYY
jgi:hypothetical protein